MSTPGYEPTTRDEDGIAARLGITPVTRSVFRRVGEETPPQDRGCRWCQALPGEWCESDCGCPDAAIHPDYRVDQS